ncbi:hypothetical protein L6452_13901 [Arctium lappa]|uniref:Uncharacterized protein n=1 Tax=Arctium lappa TaxID=4217 RepID=A0ACB9CJU0_ARCLA|nr:hypothetical protein L6452_13901 [Arctium lappa]
MFMEKFHPSCEESIAFYSFAFCPSYKYEDGVRFVMQSHPQLSLLGLIIRLHLCSGYLFSLVFIDQAS